MNKPSLFILRIFGLALFATVCLSACSDNEPEERQAFIAFLNDKVLPRKGVSLPELSGAEKKSIGRYSEHYELLTDFQETLARDAGRNAEQLLSLTEVGDLASLARAEASLKQAAKEAQKLQTLVISLREKADEAKEGLSMPDDLAPVYAPVYAKVVSLPAAASAEAFSAVHAVFAAILDLLDFIDANSRDVEIDGKNINLKNIGLKDRLDAKLAAVRGKTEDLRNAYTEMMKTMLQ